MDVTLGVVTVVVMTVVVLAGLLLHLDVRGRGGGCKRIVHKIGTLIGLEVGFASQDMKGLD